MQHRTPAALRSGLRRQILGAASILGAAGIAPSKAMAQADPVASWPAKPVRVIVPFGPGSTPDILARLVFEKVGSNTRQPFIVENRAGAGGNIGTNAVAKAAGDGYTIGVSITGPLVNNTVLYKSMPYDPFKDLSPVTLAVIQPSVLTVPTTLGVNTVGELVDLLKKNPGKFNYASVGAGTVAHLSIELIKAKSGTFIVHIPYPSSPAAVTSLLSGDTQIAALAPAAVIPQVRAGKLKALAVTTRDRYPALSDLPTFREAGILDVEASAWIGIVVPSSTPQGLVDRINRECVSALKDPGVAEKLRAQFMEPVGNSPREFAAFMQDELRRWTPVIQRAKVSLD
jgi:tripartite-type tricarboxylate transporter receptor subunit TctC